MSTPSTISLDTELSAVNSILGSIGQSPINSLSFENPEVAVIHNLLREVNVDTQNEGWSYNMEKHIKVTPDSNNELTVVNIQTVVGATVLRIDFHDGLVDRNSDVVIRNGKLYDKVNHTYKFEGDKYVDVVFLVEFNDLPSVFQRYVTMRAAGRAATQLVANPQLVQLLGSQEALARAACIEFECDQGDHSFLNIPDETSYRSFIPSDALRR